MPRRAYLQQYPTQPPQHPTIDMLTATSRNGSSTSNLRPGPIRVAAGSVDPGRLLIRPEPPAAFRVAMIPAVNG